MGIYKMIEKKKIEQKRKQKAKIAKAAGISAVVGTTLGVAAGVLFAPKSGKETRADLAEKTIKAKDELVEKSKVIKENIDVKFSEGKKDISEVKEKISAYLANKKKNEEVLSEEEEEEEVLSEEEEEENIEE